MPRVVTNLWATLVSVLAIAAGLGLLAAWESGLGHDLGAALVVTGLIGVAWDLVLKRAFAAEILEKAAMSQELAAAGVRTIGTFRRPPVDWEELFDSSASLDIFVAYARTWRRSNIENLQRFLSRKGATLRVILPRADDEAVAGELAKRFDCSIAELRERVTEAKNDYKSLAQLNPEATIEIRTFPRALQFSFYVFDRGVVLALFTHRTLTPVLTFVLSANGELYDYLKEESAGILAGSQREFGGLASGSHS